MSKLRNFLVVGVLSVAIPSVAFGTGIPVVDAANLAQSILTAARELKSNLNEAMMIKNQIESLTNEFKNLTKLDFNILDEYSNDLQDLFEKMGSIHGLMQNLNDLEAKFKELYPDFNNQGAFPSGEIISETMNNALNESRQMMLGASKTGASVLEHLPKTEQQLEELLSASHGAVGILQATQSGNQINATISSNLLNLNALLGNFIQAHMSFMQKQNTAEAVQLKRAEIMLNGKTASSEPPVPFGWH